jgi:1-acyl-sn-glycerol-3-phosphate acyltransferase
MNLVWPFRFLLSFWAMVWLAVLTGAGAFIILVLQLLRVEEPRMQWVGRLWGKLLLAGTGCPARITGLKNLTPGENYVFASNHTSALDIPALLALLPKNFRWLAKKELFAIPVFGFAIKGVGYIPIDRSNTRAAVKSLNQAAARIAAGASVVIFPEGTRSPDGKLLAFKSGGLGLAIRSGRPVTPVAIIGANRALPPKHLILNPGPIQVTVGQPIPTQGLKIADREDLTQIVRERVQELLREG